MWGECSNFASRKRRRALLFKRQALFIRVAHQATQVLSARMLRTLSLENWVMGVGG